MSQRRLRPLALSFGKPLQLCPPTVETLKLGFAIIPEG